MIAVSPTNQAVARASRVASTNRTTLRTTTARAPAKA